MKSTLIIFLYLTCSGVVALFLFIVQQVHTQPLVTTTNNITSIPTNTPKDMIRLSLLLFTLLVCDELVFDLGSLEVVTLGHWPVGWSVVDVGASVVVVYSISELVGQG